MKIAKLEVSFLLHGCRSLKDKRRRLHKLRDKFGQNRSIAVCEADFADDHRRSLWAFLVCAGSAVVVEQILSDVARYVLQSIDAEVTDISRHWLS